MCRRIILIGLLAGLSLSCSKSFEDPDVIERNDTVLDRMASNIGFFRDLAFAMEEGGNVAAWTEGNGSVTVYWDNGRVSTVWPNPADEDVIPPTVSAALQNGQLVWTVNGEVLKKSGKPFPVSEGSSPVLMIDGENWTLGLSGERFLYKPGACEKAQQACITIDESRPLTFRLLPGTDVYIEQPAWFRDLKTHDENHAFYKDIFLDAGIGLTDRKSLHAAQYLGLSLEGISGSSESYKDLFQGIIGGTAEDTNGRLLYPDGQPRFRALFVVGGSSRSHGKSLDNRALDRMRLFNANGGSYVGTCAGGFFAASGYDDQKDYPYYLHLWPGIVNHTGLLATSTGMFIDDNSPLLSYFNYGGDGYLSSVRHNKGGYPASFPFGSEVLATYDTPDNAKIHKQPSVWAYKKDVLQGRVVITGSHPEEAQRGENRDLMAAMVQYALDGQGLTCLKGILNNGQERQMYAPNERIGDRQAHHYCFKIPENASPVDISISCDGDFDWQIFLSRDQFAYEDLAEYTCASKQLHIDSLSEGLWYLSVRCMTTVDVIESETGQEYSGQVEVLNGIPYSVCVRW